MMWRYEHTPNEWVITYRFRYYSGPNIWKSKDKKSWYGAKFYGDERAAEAAFEKFAAGIALVAGRCFSATVVIHWLIVKGDWEKLLAEIERQKPFWLHTKTVNEPEEGDGIGIEK